MSRLIDVLDACASRGEKAMGLFVTDGFPERHATVPIMQAIADGGADFIELGMPFSDPLAEGIPIQRSSARALKNGVTMASTLETVRTFREQSNTPILLMGYLNPILQYGAEEFCLDARNAGVDGLILPDLPVDESDLLAAPIRNAGLDLVQLIAPNTSDKRIKQIDQAATGFVYAVSVSGLTGGAVNASTAINQYLARAREHVTENRLLVGFGIRNHEDAMALSEQTDGFVVGSALINQIDEYWADEQLDDVERCSLLSSFARSLKFGESHRATTP